MELKYALVAIIFCIVAIVIGRGIANGAVWLVEKIEKIFKK